MLSGFPFQTQPGSTNEHPQCSVNSKAEMVNNNSSHVLGLAVPQRWLTWGDSRELGCSNAGSIYAPEGPRTSW